MPEGGDEVADCAVAYVDGGGVHQEADFGEGDWGVGGICGDGSCGGAGGRDVARDAFEGGWWGWEVLGEGFGDFPGGVDGEVGAEGLRGEKVSGIEDVVVVCGSKLMA